VADEIKELSERTSASTREIEEVIKAVREDVTETSNVSRSAVSARMRASIWPRARQFC